MLLLTLRYFSKWHFTTAISYIFLQYTFVCTSRHMLRHELIISTIVSRPLSLHRSLILSRRRRRSRKIASLCCKVAHRRQAWNAPQQELQLPVRRSWHVLRDLVTGVIDRHERQAALGVRRAQDTCACDVRRGRGGDGLVLDLVQNLRKAGMVRDEEIVGWLGLETLERD